MKKILIVDDEPAITRLIKLNLEAIGGYEVATENKGAKAISVAREFKPDLAILDVMMPDLLGNEVAALLNDDPELRHIKIVFLTAILKKSEEGKSDRHTTKHRMLAKPVNIDVLVAVIHEELSGNDQ